MKCKKGKRIMKEKKKAREGEELDILCRYIFSTTTEPKPHSAPLITREETLKSNICVAHAHCKKLEKPVSYEEEMNKVLKLNNLPTIIIPKNSNSNKIYRSAEQVGKKKRSTRNKTM